MNAPLAYGKHASDLQHKRLVITGTSKGGTGRTFLLLQIVDWLNSKGVKAQTVDCDWHNASLTRFLPDSIFLDLAQPDASEQLMEAFQVGEVILLDSPGIQHPRYWEWMADSGLFDQLAQYGIGITILLTVEEDKDTVFQAAQASEAIGENADWLVVQNLKTSETTSIYEESATRQKLSKAGAQHMILDRLPWTALARMQQMSLTVGGLLELENIPPLERERLRNYQSRTFAEFERISRLLLPETATKFRAKTAIARREVVRPRIAPKEV
jgi:hypothetical protein